MSGPEVSQCPNCLHPHPAAEHKGCRPTPAPSSTTPAALSEAELQRGIVCTAENGAEIRLFPDYTVEEFIAKRLAARALVSEPDGLADQLRELHQPLVETRSGLQCTQCDTGTWPCPTIALLTAPDDAEVDRG